MSGNRGRGTSSILLQELALRIHELLVNWNIIMHFAHIPGVENVDAHKLSRRTPPSYQRNLPPRFFKKIEQKRGKRGIDAFASREDAKTKTFWSHFPDPEAAAVDAFLQKWPKKGLYIYTPLGN
jgi:hypothetical protein